MQAEPNQAEAAMDLPAPAQRAVASMLINAHPATFAALRLVSRAWQDAADQSTQQLTVRVAAEPLADELAAVVKTLRSYGNRFSNVQVQFPSRSFAGSPEQFPVPEALGRLNRRAMRGSSRVVTETTVLAMRVRIQISQSMRHAMFVCRRGGGNMRSSATYELAAGRARVAHGRQRGAPGMVWSDMLEITMDTVSCRFGSRLTGRAFKSG